MVLGSYDASQAPNGEAVTSSFLNETVGMAAKAVVDQLKYIATGKAVLQTATRGW